MTRDIPTAVIARSDVTAVILAGGKAQREGGVIPSLTPVDGTIVIERQIAVLKPKVADIEIAVSAPAPWARVQTIQDDLADLLAEFRAVEKFDHLIDLAILVKYIARIQKQCEKAGEGYEWKEED